LHIELDHTGAKAFLKKIKPVLTVNLACNQQLHDELNSLLTLEAFRLELKSLLGGFNADISVCDELKKWTTFLRLYSEVVRDANLVLRSADDPSGPLCLAVKKVTIQPLGADASGDPAVRVFPMIWHITYADGRFGLLELSKLGLPGAKVRIYGPTLGSVDALARMEGIP
ncbi:MAG TPA: hypothetical protein VFU68_09175, partial [Terracidiphilus sp.]|nr:hypothetical protein [Terracidiphilus sp.]